MEIIHLSIIYINALYEDLLRVRKIELNDSIRKIIYSFTLVNNKLRIFPNPEEDSRMYFDYVELMIEIIHYKQSIVVLQM